VENISYVIPTPVVQHFLEDVARHGRYTGFPALALETQRTESPALRGALGLGERQRGALVRRVDPTAPAAEVLAAGDVLLAFDGVAIGADGTVPFRDGERIAFSYLTSQKFVGDVATLDVLRGGAARRVRVRLAAPRRLVPVHTRGAPPSYFVYGGLVFTPATVPFLKAEYGKVGVVWGSVGGGLGFLNLWIVIYYY